MCIGKLGLMAYELKYIAWTYERKKKQKIMNPENVFKKTFPRRWRNLVDVFIPCLHLSEIKMDKVG